jgi:hypothetical protein
MELKELEGKSVRDMTDEEKSFIMDSYLKYFDTCNAKDRCAGYCIILGGIPAHTLGCVSIRFIKEGKGVSYCLMIGNLQIEAKDERLEEVIEKYIQSNRMFKATVNADLCNSEKNEIRLPLFNPKKRAGKAIFHPLMGRAKKYLDFSQRGVQLSKLGKGFVTSIAPVGSMDEEEVEEVEVPLSEYFASREIRLGF